MPIIPRPIPSCSHSPSPCARPQLSKLTDYVARAEALQGHCAVVVQRAKMRIRGGSGGSGSGSMPPVAKFTLGQLMGFCEEARPGARAGPRAAR